MLVSLALDTSLVEAEADGEGLSEGDAAGAAGGAVEITVAVQLDVVSVVPAERSHHKVPSVRASVRMVDLLSQLSE